VSAGTRNAFTVKASASLSERMFPVGFAAQFAHDTADVERGAAFATVSAPCCVPVELSVHVIAKALAGTLFVAPELLIAAPVTVRLVTVLRDERTLPETAVPVVHGAASETMVATLQVTVPFVTAIVLNTGATTLALSVPVVAACAGVTKTRFVAITAVAARRRRYKRYVPFLKRGSW